MEEFPSADSESRHRRSEPDNRHLGLLKIRPGRFAAFGIDQTDGADCGNLAGQFLERHLAGLAAARGADLLFVHEHLEV